MAGLRDTDVIAYEGQTSSTDFADKMDFNNIYISTLLRPQFPGNVSRISR